MSDEGERTCPLCAEEMDLTDQQLKPCRCGYEICVWCWHHIMDMAEKDDTEGRCPACRNPYNKEKIVGTAASCERLVTEMNMEKKGKLQKGKTKTSDGRKQLTSVRVIQKNLVYIVGLPLNLADEDLLQRREYFSLYGKVQKVSISRTAAGTIQQFPNNTCSVYITYLKEEEAVRCIQAVNGYTLEGKLLRACFGTTKYCHAWIRNVPCNNPDCLYLHEVGSQEDSFSKDEIISGYSRSRPQPVPSFTNTMQQRRSGNMLPPPADDYCNNSYASSCKSVSKSIPNTSSSLKISPPNSSSGRSTALPAGASWGSRASSNPQTPACVSSLNGSHKPDTGSGAVSFSTALTSSNHVPTLPSGTGKKLVPAEENNMGKVEYRSISEPAKQILPAEHPSSLSENSSKLASHSPSSMSSKLYILPGSKDKNKHASFPPTDTNSDDTSSESSSPSSVKDANDDIDEPVRRLSSDVSAMNIGNQQQIELGGREQCREPLTSQPLKLVESNSEIYNSCTKPSTGWDMETPVPVVQVSQLEENDELLSFDNQRLKDPEVFSGGSYFSNLSPLHGSNGHGDYTHLVNGPFAVKANLQFADNKVDSVSQFSGTPFLSSGYPENHFNSSLSNNTGQSNLSSNRENLKHVVGMHNGPVNDGQNHALDMGESSIISNILSLDYDPWNDTLNSPQNLAKYLGETDRNHVSQPSPWRAPQSNQSRFSFAREEEPYTRAPEIDSFREQAYQQSYYGRDFANKASFQGDNSGARSGFPFLNNEDSDMYSSSNSLFGSSKLTGARSQIAAPPGFANPNRAPPGFLSHERVEQPFNSFSGHNMLDTSSFRNQYQSTQAGNNYSNGDIEFMDPAILAVGKGRLHDGLNSSGLDMRSSYSPQMNNFDNDARIQMLMQRSLSSHQNQRYNDDAFSSLADSIRNPSRAMEQSLTNNMPPYSQVNHMSQSRNPLMSNGHWDSWNEVQSGNNMGVTELLRPERFSYNKYYNGYEDSKLHMPSQSDIYNRTYGI